MFSAPRFKFYTRVKTLTAPDELSLLHSNSRVVLVRNTSLKEIKDHTGFDKK